MLPAFGRAPPGRAAAVPNPTGTLSPGEREGGQRQAARRRYARVHQVLDEPPGDITLQVVQRLVNRRHRRQRRSALERLPPLRPRRLLPGLPWRPRLLPLVLSS
jgi:hypothetical protein